MRIEKGHEFTFSERKRREREWEGFLWIFINIIFRYADASQYPQKVDERSSNCECLDFYLPAINFYSKLLSFTWLKNWEHSQVKWPRYNWTIAAEKSEMFSRCRQKIVKISKEYSGIIWWYWRLIMIKGSMSMKGDNRVPLEKRSIWHQSYQRVQNSDFKLRIQTNQQSIVCLCFLPMSSFQSKETHAIDQHPLLDYSRLYPTLPDSNGIYPFSPDFILLSSTIPDFIRLTRLYPTSPDFIRLYLAWLDHTRFYQTFPHYTENEIVGTHNCTSLIQCSLQSPVLCHSYITPLPLQLNKQNIFPIQTYRTSK